MTAHLDMLTTLVLGALTCLTLSGVMLYFSVARKTYPGFHYWTLGFVSTSLGTILVCLRGSLPDFLTVIVGNMLVVAMPFMLYVGMARFAGVGLNRKLLHSLLILLFLFFFIQATYFFPNMQVRIVCISLIMIFFFGESLSIAVKHLPKVLGSQNQLLVATLGFAIVASLMRIAITPFQNQATSFMGSGGMQVFVLILIILSVVGIIGALIILNTHRMEIDLKKTNRRIEKLANQDGLTHLFNRRYFDRCLGFECKRHLRSGQPLSMIMIDIDCFKNYNDSYGHQAGDDCLKAVAEEIRKSGGRMTDKTARFGGEEFVMILPDTKAKGALKVAETIMTRIRNLAIPHASSRVCDIVTVSIGVATVIPDLDYSPAELVGRADKALYRSKAEGRNCIRTG